MVKLFQHCGCEENHRNAERMATLKNMGVRLDEMEVAKNTVGFWTA